MKTARLSDQRPADLGVAVLVLAFAGALALFAIRNYDVWWMMAVGRYMVETKAFIRTDPFTFSLPQWPWSPQGWLSAIVFYAVHGAGGVVGLVVLRAALVVATVAVVLWTLARIGVSWAASGILVVGMLLIANTRFIVRAHLFEYLFLASLMLFLLTSHERRGRGFFLLPLGLQLLWTNMHASYLLGPAFALLFFSGEWVADRASRSGTTWLRPLYPHDYRRAFLLVGAMIVVCFVTPDPLTVVREFFAGEQRELMSRYTLEWRSPFDPAIAAGNFHPYYEVLLAVCVLAVAASLRRLPLSLVLVLGATVYLSLQSHRFRVEFALVAIPVLAVLIRDLPWSAALARRAGKERARWVMAALALVMMVTTAGRIDIRPGLGGRYPDEALSFIVENDVAQRPFNTIAFGSYMTWRLYGQRLHFIDGRNFDAGLHRVFLAAQSTKSGLEQTIARFQIDSFLIPALHRSDAGMRHIHEWLHGMDGWSLVHVDDVAFLYVSDASVPASFLEEHAYRYYHPLSLGNRRMSQQEIDGIIAELERAVTESPLSARLWLALGMTQAARGNLPRALDAVERSLSLEPGNETALGMRGQLMKSMGR